MCPEESTAATISAAIITTRAFLAMETSHKKFLHPRCNLVIPSSSCHLTRPSFFKINNITIQHDPSKKSHRFVFPMFLNVSYTFLSNSLGIFFKPNNDFTWPKPIMIAAADTKPLITGREIKRTKKPSRRRPIKSWTMPQ